VRFDRCFSRSAIDAGVEIMTSTRFAGAVRSKEGFVVRTSMGMELRSRVLIGADGASSQVARTCRFPRTDEVIPTCGIYAEDHDCEGSFVDVYVGSKVAPGFFAWAIPNSESVNVGLGTRYGVSPQGYLKRFLKKKGMDRGGSWKTYYASGIPVGPRATTAKGGVALVGDAAGHAKPMSGGGIYTGLRCATILAKVTCETLERGGAPDLGAYDVAWRRALGKELKRGMWLRKVYLNMNDRHMDEICRLFGSEGILSVINEEGDLDYPSRLVLPLLRRAPGLAKFAGPLLKSLI
jgi:flavin-dependent dehydrogenase